MPKKKKRAKLGDGSFRFKPSGLIEYRFCYKNEYGESKRKAVSGETRQECLDKADEFLEGQAKLAQGIDINASISDILRKKYDADYAKNYLSIGAYARNVETVKILERGGIGLMPIKAVERKHIETFSGNITHYANSTIEKLYIQLRLAFDIAFEEGIVSKNLMQSRSIRRPKSKKQDKKVTAFTVEEQKRFVDAINSYKPQAGRNDYRLQLFIELYSGMRMGEINALTLNSIDLDNNVVHVSATITKGFGNEWHLKDGTKTTSGVRDVPISDVLRPYLEEALRRYKRNPNKLVFFDHAANKLITTNQVNSYFKRICKSAGIEPCGQHTLRHTFATRCVESGIQPVVLKTWLGHTDIHMTLDTYTEVLAPLENKAIEMLDSHLASIDLGFKLGLNENEENGDQ